MALFWHVYINTQGSEFISSAICALHIKQIYIHNSLCFVTSRLEIYKYSCLRAQIMRYLCIVYCIIHTSICIHIYLWRYKHFFEIYSLSHLNSHFEFSFQSSKLVCFFSLKWGERDPRAFALSFQQSFRKGLFKWARLSLRKGHFTWDRLTYKESLDISWLFWYYKTLLIFIDI